MSVVIARRRFWWPVALLGVTLPVGLCAQPGPPSKPGSVPPPAGAPVRPQVPPDVQKAMAQYERAVRLHRENLIPDAIRAYQEYLRLAVTAKLPPNALLPGYLNLARLYQATRQWKEQEAALRQALRLDPKNGAASAQLVTLLSEQKRHTEAKAIAAKALSLKLTPDETAQLHFALGMSATEKDDLATAEKEFAAAARQMPNRAQIQFNYALVLGRQKKFQPALSAVEKTIRLAPEMLPARLLRANLRLEAKDYPGALAAYEEVLKRDPKEPTALFNRALLLHQTGRIGEAISAYQAFLKVQPDNLAARANLGQIYYEQGNYAAARQHLAAAARIAPKEPRMLCSLAQAEFEEARRLRDPGQQEAGIERALEQARKALQLNPKDPLARNTLGYILEQSNRYAEALTYYRKLRAEEPDNIAHYYGLQRVYTMKQEPEGILETWRAYRARKPDAPESYQMTAKLLEAQGKFVEAIAEWKLWLLRKPSDGNAMLAVGQNLARLEQNDQARAQFLAALELQPDLKEAADARARSIALSSNRTLRLEALRALAKLAQKENKHAEEASWLEQALQIETELSAKTMQPLAADLYPAIVRAYEADNRPERVEQTCRAWIKALPDDAAPWAELGRLYDRQNKLEEAVNAYRQAAVRSKTADYNLQIAELYARRQQYERAIAEYEAVRMKFPKETRAYSLLAQTFEQMGADARALATYEALLKADPTQRWVYDRKAVCLVRLKRYAEAKAIYEQEIALTPEKYQTYADLARVYELMGQKAAYLPWLQARLERTPSSGTLMGAVLDAYADQKREPEGYAYLKTVVEKHAGQRAVLDAYASLLLQRERREEALAVYRRIAEQNPKDLPAQLTLGDQLGAAGKMEEGVAHFETVVARAGLTENERFPFRRQLADWYAKLGKLEPAIAQCEAILKAFPDDIGTTLGLAQLLSRVKREPEAVNLLLRLNKPEYPEAMRSRALRYIGDIYAQQGRKTDAIAQYREALKLDPKNAEAQEGLRRLEAG